MPKKIVRLRPLIAPMIITRKYMGELSHLVGEMVKEYNTLLRIYKDNRGQFTADAWGITELDDRIKHLSKKWQERFIEYAKNNVPKIVDALRRQSDLQIKEILKDWFAEQRFTLFGQNIPVPMRQVIKACIEENVSYITTLPQQYNMRVSGAVYRAVSGGGTFKQLRNELFKYADMTYRRAKLVASDQTHKAFTSIAAKRMETLGITKYEWIHTGAGKTHRPYHKAKWDGVSGKTNGEPNGLNGFIFDMKHQPVIDKRTGQTGLPGQLPFCHCRLAPVIEF